MNSRKPMPYPVNLFLAGRKCLVLGGGAVAERKALALLTAGAAVTLLSPALTPGLAELAAGGLRHISQAYQPGNLAGYFIVVCATDDPAINRQAAAEARQAGALVNVVDAPELGDFTVPAHLTRGDLLIAISTGGQSPALARRLREELEERYGPEYGMFLALAARLRTEEKSRLATAAARGEFWRQVLDGEIMDLVKAGKLSEAEAKLRDAACCFRS